MISLKPITTEEVSLYKAVRLRALRDTPTAFGSTFARESLFSDADWLRRAAGRTDVASIGYLALEDGEGCGLVGGFLEDEDPTQAHLVSMWTAPTHRRRGVGRLLVGAVLEWARRQKAETLRLTVTSNNSVAIRFYEGRGFTMTGEAQPYPNDPALVEFGMSRPTFLTAQFD